ncbi:MAG: hypothetical protein GY854_01730 [Deltaproteobacteria bacterium]|nr:hypothetical protein [Deltaproteobacteria bacterium]
MEDFFEQIGWVVFLLIWILPRLVRFFIKRSGTTIKGKKAGPLQPKTQEPILIPEEDFDSIESIDVDTQKISKDELDELARNARALRERAEEMERTCAIHEGATAKIGDTLESSLKTPVKAVIDFLDARIEREDYPDWDDAQRVRSTLSRLEKLAKTLEAMIEQRISPESADTFALLDVAAQECLVPYLTHARRMGLAYPTRFAVAVFGEPGDDMASLLGGASIAPVVIRAKTEKLPAAWVHLASDAAFDVFHSTPGLAREIATDIGVMPAPLSLTHYSDQTSFVAGLMGGWLARVYADTGAALMLGPAFCSGIVRWLEQSTESTEAVTTIIGDRPHMLLPPLQVRVFVACRVLQHLGMSDDATSRWQEWNKRVDNPSDFILQGTDGRTGTLPMKTVLGAVGRVVDYLMEEPLGALGGAALPTIPSLVCGPEIVQQMEEVGQRFTNGEAVDVPGRVIIGAAQLAVERVNALERKVADTAFHSLAGDSETIETRVRSGEPASLAGHLQSRELLVRAIVTGAAIAPRNTRRGLNRF